jgi:hypothetical protein
MLKNFKTNTNKVIFNIIKMKYSSDYEIKQKLILEQFYSTSQLQFDNKKDARNSQIAGDLGKIFQEDYEFEYEIKKTIPMRDTLEKSKLASLYKKEIDDKKYLIGLRGISINTVPYTIPGPYDGNWPRVFETNNVDHNLRLFFIGDKLEVLWHYSEISAKSGIEKINSKSNPTYYPDAVGVIVFGSKEIIQHIGQGGEKGIGTGPISAFIPELHKHYPDGVKIGNEIRVQVDYHQHLTCLPFVQYKVPREKPLSEDKFYFSCDPDKNKRMGSIMREAKWEKDIGFIDIETGIFLGENADEATKKVTELWDSEGNLKSKSNTFNSNVSNVVSFFNTKKSQVEPVDIDFTQLKDPGSNFNNNIK